MNKFKNLGVVWLLIIGIIQIVTGFWGISHEAGMFWAMLALGLFIFLHFTLPLTIGSFFCAMNVWGCNWFVSTIFALPGLLFVIPGVISSLIAALRTNTEHKSQTSGTLTVNFKKARVTRTFCWGENFRKAFKKAIMLICGILLIATSIIAIITYNKWDQIIVNDDEFLKEISEKIQSDGINSLSPSVKDRYFEIKRLNENISQLNYLGRLTISDRANKANLDYALGRFGVAWAVKKNIYLAKIHLKLAFLWLSYQYDPHFILSDHIEELTKEIMGTPLGHLRYAVSLEHARAIRELLVYKAKYLN